MNKILSCFQLFINLCWSFIIMTKAQVDLPANMIKETQLEKRTEKESRFTF